MPMMRKVSVGILFLAVATVVYGKDHEFLMHCPQCTDAYDWTSCSLTQTCHHPDDICELRVDINDKNRLEYKCHKYHACHQGCHDGICSHCCWNLKSCNDERHRLFNTIYQPSPTTTAPKVTTTTTTTQPAISTTAAPPNSCIQCGDLDTQTSCSPSELTHGTSVICPDNQPVCFSILQHNDTQTHFYKGCATTDYCNNNSWSDTQPNPGCDQPDMSTSDSLYCNYCCEGLNCNLHIKPDNNTLF